MKGVGRFSERRSPTSSKKSVKAGKFAGSADLNDGTQRSITTQGIRGIGSKASSPLRNVFKRSGVVSQAGARDRDEQEEDTGGRSDE